MSIRQSSLYRIVMVGLSLACLAGTIALGYFSYFKKQNGAAVLAQAEKSYQKGLASYEAQKYPDALVRFDEARLYTNIALSDIDKDIRTGKGTLPPEELRTLQGKLAWLKARAMRDLAFTQAQVDGKPLTETLDSTTQEKFRSFFAIPNDESRTEALGALTMAAQVLKDDPEVVKESIRVELSLPKTRWNLVEPLCRAALQMNPKDSRALYTLARYEFEQPFDSGEFNDKKDRERIEKSLDWIRQARDASAPLWRTLYLELEDLRWMSQDAKRRARPSEAIDKSIKKLVFDANDGALAVAARGDKLANLAKVDHESLMGIYQIASEIALEDIRASETSRSVLQVMDSLLNMSTKLSEAPGSSLFLSETTANLASIAGQLQTAMSRNDSEAWKAIFPKVKAFIEKNPDAVKSQPTIRLAQSQLISREILEALKEGNTARAKELSDTAIQVVEDGLKAAEEAKQPTEDFHVRLFEIKFNRGIKSEVLEQHLKALRESRSPKAQVVARLFEAKLAVRQGRLTAARRMLEMLTSGSKDNEVVMLRASATLANVAAMLGEPSVAINVLRDVEVGYERLGATDRDWVTAEFPTPADVTVAQVNAQYNAAIQRAARQNRENPGKPISFDLISPYEKAAEGFLKKLKTPSVADREARLFQTRFLAMTGRKPEADTKLAALAVDYPNSVAVLRALASTLVDTKAETPDVRYVKADDRIKQFLAKYENSPDVGREAKLYWAEWLATTGRNAQAIAFLRDPVRFPDKKDPVVEKLLAAALYQSGQREEGRRLLEALPPDAAISDVLIRGAASAAEREKKLSEAIARYENNGYFRVYQAAVWLSEGKFEEAARDFASAAEIAQVSETARAGIYTALTNYAARDPNKARNLAVEIAKNLQDEPRLYAAAAVAARYLDDIGDPKDDWLQTKTMYAAANRWEQASIKANLPRQQIGFVKAIFHLDAGDVVAAKAEATSNAQRYKDHAPTLLLLAGLAIDYPEGPNPIEAATSYLEAARQADPDNANLPWAEARIKEMAGERDAAAKLYERMVSLNPRNGQAYNRLIVIAESQKKPDLALRWCTKWMAELPNDGPAHSEMIRLLTQAGSKKEARIIADDYVKKQMDILKKATESNPLLKDAKTQDSTKVDAIFVTVTGFFRGGDYEESALRLKSILSLHPDSQAALLVLGDICLLKQEWDAALGYYRQIISKNPRHYTAGNNVAWILAAKKNNPAEAYKVVLEVRMGSAQKPVGVDRLPADFLDTMGLVYMKLNSPERYAEMRDIFQRAVERYPTDPRMYYFLAEAQAALKETSRAQAMFEMAVKLASQLPPGSQISEDQKLEVLQNAKAALRRFQGN